MKLIRSHREQRIREELVRSNISLQDGSYGQLVEALECANVNVAGAYVLNWIPEQAEDIYDIVVSADEVIIVEVPRGEGQITLEREELAKYERKCSKAQRLKIAVARDLFAPEDQNSLANERR